MKFMYMDYTIWFRFLHASRDNPSYDVFSNDFVDYEGKVLMNITKYNLKTKGYS